MLRPIRSIIIIFAVAGLLVPFFLALAHQPRFIPATPATITVTNPDTSQAFYGDLRNAPDLYSFTTDKPLHLYASILVPDIPHTDTDVFVIATDVRTKETVFTLNGITGEWKRFYEPFGGDWYLQGPETELDVPAGTYAMTVNSADNAGKYVLAIGKTESFPLREIVSAFLTVPRIKMLYFGKSIPEILISPWGISLVAILILVGLFIFLFVYLFSHYSIGKRFLSFCSMLYYRYIRKVG